MNLAGAGYTKRLDTYMHTEVVYMKDGEEIGREENYDGHLYDTDYLGEMTAQEIEDYA